MKNSLILGIIGATINFADGERVMSLGIYFQLLALPQSV